ncbi:TIGR00296 family protein [Candidatus Micrarchaeota archaeon]|nr:TIGR00296 family protein [Candidatus Micrarchaeota archaeon]
MVSELQADYLIKLARNAVEQYIETNKKITPTLKDQELNEEAGVYVTLKSFPEEELRGEIGYPYPMGEISSNIIDNAISAALHDPRFPSIKKDELNTIIFEISILSRPKILTVSSPEDYISKIKIGKNGLIIKYGGATGVLLPQIPIEYNWGAKEFLCQTCQKAGLPKEMWKRPTVEIYTFEAEIIKEEKPLGKVIKKRLFR